MISIPNRVIIITDPNLDKVRETLKDIWDVDALGDIWVTVNGNGDRRRADIISRRMDQIRGS